MRPPHHEPADLRSILSEGYGVVFDSLKLETVEEVLMMGDKDVRTAKGCVFSSLSVMPSPRASIENIL